jgi:D-alanyl-lipoteichoic acid acyltransferase DltB (MBOAT superfamily)
MLFNSSSFALFFPIVTLVYFLLPHRLRPAMLLVASIGFYMAFIPVYILILVFTILLDYVAGLAIGATQGTLRRFWLIASLVSNLGVLAVFKYYNFFIGNLTSWTGLQIPLLNLVLPLGLSFHTFQSMSYTIEVYRGNHPVEQNLGRFALYVLFWPQLVAGPIERPQNLLPQFQERHFFDYDRTVDGLRLMAWGFLKKIFVADRLGLLVDPVYNDPTRYQGLPLIIATVGFSFQIYCDFSGYSDIARGAARVMGFRLMRNFDKPYLAASIPDFWRRWHISLSTWFRDYLYFPLGGNRVPLPRQCLNIAVVFLLSGLWHGANWTFLIWGTLHAAFFIAARILPLKPPASLPGRAVRVLAVFVLVTVAWIFFRARTVGEAAYILSHLHLGFGSAAAQFYAISASYGTNAVWALLGVSLLMTAELATGPRDPSEEFQARPGWVRWSAYYAVLLLILVGGVFAQSPFIYFQF